MICAQKSQKNIIMIIRLITTIIMKIHIMLIIIGLIIITILFCSVFNFKLIY